MSFIQCLFSVIINCGGKLNYPGYASGGGKGIASSVMVTVPFLIDLWMLLLRKNTRVGSDIFDNTNFRNFDLILLNYIYIEYVDNFTLLCLFSSFLYRIFIR